MSDPLTVELAEALNGLHMDTDPTLAHGCPICRSNGPHYDDCTWKAADTLLARPEVKALLEGDPS